MSTDVKNTERHVSKRALERLFGMEHVLEQMTPEEAAEKAVRDIFQTISKDRPVEFKNAFGA